MKNITDYFFDAINTPSDVSEHIQTLYSFAKKCRHVTEFGFRTGVSTWALLATIPKTLVSYDIFPCYFSEHARIAKELNVDFSGCVGNTLSITIADTDLLFIDTLHNYAQLYAELMRHHANVNQGGCIIMHDTHTFGKTDESGFSNGPQGLQQAISDFCRQHTEWSVCYHTNVNNGLTVLQRHQSND